MKHILPFLKQVGKLKDIKRQGILYYGFKNADSAADHVFRLATMVWIFGTGKKLDVGKAFKLAIVHDLCKVYTGDITPYEGMIPKGSKNKYKLAWRWRRLSLKEKEKRYQEKYTREYGAMKKLVANLPVRVKTEIMDIWLDYQKMGSPEAKFVFQLDRAENLLEALECWQKDKRFPTLPWWEHADQVVGDKEILSLMEEISMAEVSRRGKKGKK